MNDLNKQESDLIVFLTGKTKTEVLNEYSLPELIRLSRCTTFMNGLPI